MAKRAKMVNSSAHHRVEDELEAAFRRMEAEGLLTRPTKKGSLGQFKPTKLRPATPSIAEAIAEDREDRF